MNAYATHGGVDKKRFELFALVASIIGKCHFCVASHYENLKQDGLSTEQLRDAGRIASVVNAAALALTAQASKPRLTAPEKNPPVRTGGFLWARRGGLAAPTCPGRS